MLTPKYSFNDGEVATGEGEAQCSCNSHNSCVLCICTSVAIKDDLSAYPLRVLYFCVQIGVP